MCEQSVGRRLRDGPGLAHLHGLVQRRDRGRTQALDLHGGMHPGTQVELVPMQQRHGFPGPEQEALPTRADRAAEIRHGPAPLRMQQSQVLAGDRGDRHHQVALRISAKRHDAPGLGREGERVP